MVFAEIMDIALLGTTRHMKENQWFSIENGRQTHGIDSGVRETHSYNAGSVRNVFAMV